MGFKSVAEYNDERYKGVFRIVNDGGQADVIFLLRSEEELGVWNAHYIKSAEYSGYTECCGVGCPACAKGVRVQARKVFVPLYNLANGEVEFWDRNYTFLTNVLEPSVFDNYPNPSEYVFRITRTGAANSRDTRYGVQAIAKNTVMSYDQLMAKFNLKCPDFYSNVIKSYSVDKLNQLLTPSVNYSNLSDYVPTPRAGYASTIPDAFVDSSTLLTDNTPNDIMPTSEISEESDNADDEDGNFPEPTF